MRCTRGPCLPPARCAREEAAGATAARAWPAGTGGGRQHMLWSRAACLADLVWLGWARCWAARLQRVCRHCGSCEGSLVAARFALLPPRCCSTILGVRPQATRYQR
jgi:hypothetical protein